jgi:hypothetical protein
MFKNISYKDLKDLILFNNTNRFTYSLNGNENIYITNMKGKHLDNMLKNGNPKETNIDITSLLNLKLPTTKGDWIVIYDKIFDEALILIY